MKTDYLINFSYYHYNTGRANNGHFTGSVKAATLEEANNIASQIEKAITDRRDCLKNYRIFEGDPELEDMCFGGDGYFTSLDGIFERTIETKRIA